MGALPSVPIFVVTINFVDKSEEKINGVQMGSWVDLQNLSTREWIRARVDQLGLCSISDLKPGNYRLWTRRRKLFPETCGVRRESWKIHIDAGKNNNYQLTVQLINNTGCAIE
jgi:hypothetical protein